MATVLMKNGEIIEVPDDEMLSFLPKNRDLIQDRYSPRKRLIKRSDSSKLKISNIK
ncbi:conserved hypothetical protein [Gloeothece citriformis PCC 7424]|uniref:Uncharacterized protein n=1 Tax=Gloeothece citriformis (strain PCC 7424) TaxID=65393 RepID=B7K8Q7_GLOC7|nr:hypothetical protein [Gloeothece citriformis]ACK71255.1 conserved hypothetical protein [Gloeothece citriformis PCC 7424]